MIEAQWNTKNSYVKHELLDKLDYNSTCIFSVGYTNTPSAANRPLPAVRLHCANDPFDGQHVGY